MKPSSESDFEASLLSALQAGRWKPGERLPTTAGLAEESGVDLRTVQRALASLAARGLLDRRPRLGTFVRESAAPLTVGLLTGWNLKLERNAWPRLFAHELERALGGYGYRLHLFDDFFAFMQNDEAIWQTGIEQLSRELAEVSPVGFVELQVHLSRVAPVYTHWQRPTVHCGRKEYGSEVLFDRPGFYRESLDWLADQGCRRVLLIRKGALLESFPEEDAAFWQAAKRHRFLRASIREVFVREQNPDVEAGAAHLLESLVAEWRTARRSEIPDALLVTDDVMMRGVITGLLRSGFSGEQTLLTMATEGIDLHYALPVARYEFPLADYAREAARRLHLKLSRQPLPKGSRGPTFIPGRLLPPAAAAPPPAIMAPPLSHL